MPATMQEMHEGCFLYLSVHMPASEAAGIGGFAEKFKPFFVRSFCIRESKWGRLMGSVDRQPPAPAPPTAMVVVGIYFHWSGNSDRAQRLCDYLRGAFAADRAVCFETLPAGYIGLNA